MRRSFRFRLRILAGIILCIAVFLVGRLYYVQVIKGADYAEKGNRQYLSSSQELYDRGNIYFTLKDGTLISAATLASGFLIAIDPEELKNPQSVYDALNAQTAISSTTFFAAVAKTDDPYQVIVHHVPDSVGASITSLNIPGVLVERERWRIYPAGTEAAQTLGFIAYNSNNVQTGQAGLEESYNDVLERPSAGLIGNFFAELFANLNSVTGPSQGAGEGDVVTSIEPLVEQRLDEDIEKVNNQYHSTETGGIIMDPKTGAIIALDSYPTFNPNDLADGNPEYFGNGLVQHEYEFGSIVKSLTMASGLDSGVINVNTTYDDTGCIHPNGQTICNYDLVARGVIPMDQILFQSLNLGASFIAGRLGHVTMRNYFTKLGLGQLTHIDLPGEIPGHVQNLFADQDVDYDTAAFGQGIAVTPVQMIRALSSLANNGAIVSPHVASSIQLENGTTKILSYPPPVQVFKPESVKEVTTMLHQVFLNDAALAMASNPGLPMPTVDVVAKTGTAQVVDPSGGYYHNVFFHSFFGFFPASNPQFIILLYTNRPQGVEYASGTLTETFMDLTNFLVNYYELPPDAIAGKPYANPS